MGIQVASQGERSRRSLALHHSSKPSHNQYPNLGISLLASTNGFHESTTYFNLPTRNIFYSWFIVGSPDSYHNYTAYIKGDAG